MADQYVPLTAHPTHKRPAMLIDSKASFEELYDCAGLRLSAARDMLFTVTTLGSESKGGAVDGRDLSSIAHAAYLLLNDADDLMNAVGHAHSREVAHG
ncbi:hypothetical protein [uncultured Kushneria sp.]|uniref:hypothetical protein n=1 Tax=uncultured Kushneria sp. TaxID=905033 RepID=UPI0026327F72|nr:hypothetical protein [uncultured Kushneria sp.]